MKTAPRKRNPRKRDAGKGRGGKARTRKGSVAKGAAAATPAESDRRFSAPEASAFHTPDRITLSGLTVGDICFDCECRILEIGGPDAMILAWCECAWPDDHAEMEVG
jgi:hypothetical protein